MKKGPRRPWFWLAGAAASGFVYLNRRLFLVNDVTAGRTTDYPDLKPHAYAYPPAEVFAIVEAAAREDQQWRVVTVDRVGREIQAEVETSLFGMIDDITIRVNAMPLSTASEVVARSRSRRRGGDLGGNARRIKAYYHSLDARILKAGSADRDAGLTPVSGAGSSASAHTVPGSPGAGAEPAGSNSAGDGSAGSSIPANAIPANAGPANAGPATAIPATAGPVRQEPLSGASSLPDYDPHR